MQVLLQKIAKLPETVLPPKNTHVIASPIGAWQSRGPWSGSEKQRDCHGPAALAMTWLSVAGPSFFVLGGHRWLVGGGGAARPTYSLSITAAVGSHEFNSPVDKHDVGQFVSDDSSNFIRRAEASEWSGGFGSPVCLHKSLGSKCPRALPARTGCAKAHPVKIYISGQTWRTRWG